jgi:hypothetical protein
LDNLYLAFFVAASTAISPILMAWLTNRNRRQEKQEDYARQDAVAAKAAEAARLLAERQDAAEEKAAAVARQAKEAARLLSNRQDQSADKAAEVARKADRTADLLLAANERVAANAEVTSGKLDAIHILVNSKFTDALERTLKALVAQATMSREMIAERLADGRPPKEGALQAVEALDRAISEQRLEIADLAAQTGIAKQTVARLHERT